MDIIAIIIECLFKKANFADLQFLELENELNVQLETESEDSDEETDLPFMEETAKNCLRKQSINNT